MDAGRELAGESIFHEPQQFQAKAVLICPLSAAVENSKDTDCAVMSNLSNRSTSCCHRHRESALERAHAQMLQSDRVLVAHGLQMTAMTPPMVSISVSEPKARSPCTSSGSTTSSCGMCGITKERRLRLPRSPTVPGEPGARVGSRFRRPAYSSTMICRVRTGLAEQVELLQPPVAVGQEVDGGRQAGHRSRGFQRVLHLGSPE